MAKESCAHPDCECALEKGQGVSRGGETFCSEQCANASQSGSDDCECGHADCQ